MRTMFGLAELHQLRGRVGRYKHRAYCYLLLPEDKVLSEVALKRLRAIEQYAMLGAGFKIAMRDLEIRGAGNLLGHGAEPATSRRWGMRCIASLLEQEIANEYDDLEKVQHDIESAYGELPRAGRVLVELAELRISAMKLDIISIRRHERDVIFRTKRPDLLESRMAGAKGTLRLVGQPNEEGLTEVYYRPPARHFEDLSLLRVLRTRLRSSDSPAKLTRASVEESATAH
jgi:transcription-repair coupling factor (superfamily II helicase)